MPVVNVQGLGRVRFPDGTDEATMSSAIEGMLRQQRVETVKLSDPSEYDPSSPEYQAKYGPTSGNSGAQNAWEGWGSAIPNVARQVGNMVGLVPDETVREADALDAPLLATKGGFTGRFLGDTAVVTALTGGAGSAISGGASALNLARVAKIAASPIGRGIIEGGLQGAILAGPDNRLGGAGIGAAVGGAVPAVIGGVRGALQTVANGAKRTPQAQRLLDEGVSLTPGQMNPSGVLNHVEEAIQSVPFAGTVIKNARDSAMDDWQRAFINRGSMAPAAANKAQTLANLLDDAERSFAPFYDEAKGFPLQPAIVNTGANVPLSSAIKRAVQDPAIFADDAARSKVAKFVTNQLTAAKGDLTSDGLLTIRSAVRAEARAARIAGDDATRKLFEATDKQMTKALYSQLPGRALKALQAADAKYGRYKVAEAAMFKAGARAGGFTPSQAAQAVKEATKAKVFATGGGVSRDLADDAARVFEVRQPPTGARLATVGALLKFPAIGIPVAAGSAALASTATGRALSAGQTAWQRQMARALQAASGNPAFIGANQLADIYGRSLLTSRAIADAYRE